MDPVSILLPLALAALLAALGLGVAALRLARRARTAEAELAARENALAAQRRHLGVLARELTRPGLELMALSERLAQHPDLTVSTSLYLQTIGRLRSGAAHLLNLADETGDSLAEQQAERGEGRRLSEEPLRLGEILQEALAEVQRPMGEGMRLWRIDPECENVTLLGDRRALGRALFQILARAVRDTGMGDCIAIHVHRQPGRFALVIEDEGHGATVADLGDTMVMRAGTRGLELGLATSRDLLHAHGGDLTVEAMSGIGSRVWMTLPEHRLLSAAGT
ncbi:HAMP domain-containing histidine kinase [Roseomonas gilardii subsp. gilardii]|uniref:sensor histidine kinase n=1 Tax=Roseomonas gilardii TaxID=257708 RepID=UPI001FF798DE|nr:HAMP domain-containing sensor histidine kinase [Roseomonas gilardii]UPG72190.1 HAMP domain-containing histidine kinase [Roseomonas gilardii subsp. gilardii]